MPVPTLKQLLSVERRKPHKTSGLVNGFHTQWEDQSSCVEGPQGMCTGVVRHGVMQVLPPPPLRKHGLVSARRPRLTVVSGPLL